MPCSCVSRLSQLAASLGTCRFDRLPLDLTTLRPLPCTPAVSGVLETLAFFRDPDFARSRFERFGDVYETSLLGQRTVFIRGGQAISDLFPKAMQWLAGGQTVCGNCWVPYRWQTAMVPITRPAAGWWASCSQPRP